MWSALEPNKLCRLPFKWQGLPTFSQETITWHPESTRRGLYDQPGIQAVIDFIDKCEDPPLGTGRFSEGLISSPDTKKQTLIYPFVTIFFSGSWRFGYFVGLFPICLILSICFWFFWFFWVDFPLRNLAYAWAQRFDSVYADLIFCRRFHSMGFPCQSSFLLLSPDGSGLSHALRETLTFVPRGCFNCQVLLPWRSLSLVIVLGLQPSIALLYLSLSALVFACGGADDFEFVCNLRWNLLEWSST